MDETSNTYGLRNHTMWFVVYGNQKLRGILRIVMVEGKTMQKTNGTMVINQPHKTDDDDWSWCRRSEIVYVFVGA